MGSVAKPSKPRTGVMHVYKRTYTKRIAYGLFGVFSAAVAVPVAITGIGVLIAIPLVYASKEHMMRAMGREYITCVDCLSRSTIRYNIKTFTCGNCAQSCRIFWKKMPRRSEYKRIMRSDRREKAAYMRALSKLEG